MTLLGPLDKTFTAALHKSPAKGGWTYVVTDWSADFFHRRPAAAPADHRSRLGTADLIEGRRSAPGMSIPGALSRFGQLLARRGVAT